MKYWIWAAIVFICFVVKMAVGALIFGSTVIFTALRSLRLMRRIQRNGIECTGTIVSFNTNAKGYKIPVVEFSPAPDSYIKDEPFVYASTDLGLIRTYASQINKEVKVVYDPEEPGNFLLDREQGFNYFFLGVMVFVGSAFIVLSVCALIWNIG